MTIALLEILEWHGTDLRDQVVEHPSLEAVREAVRALDANVRNDVYLRLHADTPAPWLCVGGGAGRYVVTGALDDVTFPTLADPLREGAPEEYVLVGGQTGNYPGHWVHPLDTALRAAEHFWRTGEFGGAGLTWEHT